MTLHDHGTWTGPCSDERHALIERGKVDPKTHEPETTEEFLARWARCVIDDKCACCGVPLIARRALEGGE